MPDLPPFEAVVEHGVAGVLLNPAARRREAADHLIRITSSRLSQPVDEVTRNRWAAQLVQVHWPELLAERGDGWPAGWPELMGSMATVIELLARHLPPQIEAAIAGSPASDEWRRRRAPFQRFAVAVALDKVHFGRAFLAHENGQTEWRTDLPNFSGRSHTLLISLLAAGAIPPDFGPLAVTGAIAADGLTVEPVEAVRAKAEAWFEREPVGWFVSPPFDVGSEGDDRRMRWRGDRLDRATRWIVGGSVAEIRAKLTGNIRAIPAWDGRPIADSGLGTAKLGWQRDRPEHAPYDDVLLWALRAAAGLVPDAPACRGLLVTGAPGSGKSIWSRCLERDFRTGGLGSLGFAVRRTAREVMEDVGGASNWADLLAKREPSRRELFAELARTQRLVPIIDGLDELDAPDLHVLASWLRAAPGVWVVTGRPVPIIRELLPPVFHLGIEDLRSEEGRRILVGLHREDLADRLFPDRYGRGAKASPAVEEMCRTPFHLTLLARVVAGHESIDHLDVHELYRRAFDGLLMQARTDNRLSSAEERLLRTLLDTAVGDLALEWLTSGARFLSRQVVNANLSAFGLSPRECADAIRAMEFGYLLAPASGAWDFAHRTLAEWAAASALRRRVSAELAAEASDDRGGRGAAEGRVLASVLGADVLLHTSKHRQLLVFYGPFITEPLPLMLAALGPTSRPRWRVREEPRSWRITALDDEEVPTASGLRSAHTSELKTEWHFVLRLLASCTWKRSDDAIRAWGCVVRARRRTLLGERGHASDGDARGSIEALAARLGPHLPRTLTGLLDAASGGVQEERGAVVGDIEVLIESVPPRCAGAVEELLKRGSRQDQAVALAWFERHTIEAPTDQLTAMAAALPREIATAEGEARAYGDVWSEAARPARNRATMLGELEDAVWRAASCPRSRLPWNLVRTRLAAWPAHLRKGITSWFAVPAGDGDDEQHRRVALSMIAEPVARTCAAIVALLAELEPSPEREAVVHAVLKGVDDEDDHYRRRRFDEFVTDRGWQIPHFGSGAGHREGRIVAALSKNIHALQRQESALDLAIRALHESRLDAVVGELISVLPPAHPVRYAIVRSCLENKRLPAQLPIASALPRLQGYSWQYRDYAWRPAHVAQLRLLSETARGAERFAAVEVLAAVEGRDANLALLSALPSDDEEFESKVRDHLGHRGVWNDVPLALLPPGLLASMPLEFRAERNVPGWRAELFAAMSGGREQVVRLAALAARLGVSGALPLITSALEVADYRTSTLIEAIGVLATDEDSNAARAALKAGFQLGSRDRPMHMRGEEKGASPWSRLLRFLRLEDVDVIAALGVSALADEELTQALRRLGPSAFDRLRQLHGDAAERRALAQRASVLDRKSDSPWLGALRNRHGESPSELEAAEAAWAAIGGTLAAIVDPRRESLESIVTLCFDVTGGDEHEVYSTPGPLGADFDEPGDLDWSSSHKNAPIIDVLCAKLGTRLEAAPSEWPTLRRLFAHPSETMRKRAFEAAARLAPAHEAAGLALEALEGHARCNRTRWTGNTPGLLLAGLEGGGSGSIGIDIPDTAETLVGAVRRRLTAAHREALLSLVGHELPPFRGLAAKWAGELGPPEWAELVIPLLADGDAHVVRRALEALRELVPQRLGDALWRADRSRWTAEHDVFVLHDLMSRLERRHPGINWLTEVAVNPLEVLPGTLLAVLIAEAAERLRPRGERRHRPTAFDGLPSLVERVDRHLRTRPELDLDAVARLHVWRRHRDVRVRTVARRALSERGLLTTAHVRRLLQSKHPMDRLSAAECLTRLSVEPTWPTIRGYWNAAFGYSSWKAPAATLAVLGLPPGEAERGRRKGDVGLDSESLKPRLIWALKGATVKFASLLSLFAKNIYRGDDDDEGDTETPRVVIDIVKRWGARGAITLLQAIEAREIDDAYEFDRFLFAAARRWPKFQASVRLRAAAGGEVAAKVVEELDRPSEAEALDTRMRMLAEEVFVMDCPLDLSQCNPAVSARRSE